MAGKRCHCLSFASLHIHSTYFMKDEGFDMKISKITLVENFYLCRILILLSVYVFVVLISLPSLLYVSGLKNP